MTARYLGIDVARFLAIAGMMAAHLVTIGALLAEPGSFAESAGALTDMLTEGIAAPLFAVLGGVSVVFATRRPLREGRVGAAIGSTLIRGTLLILIGLLLGLIETPVAIVLAYYGTAMILVAPLIAVRGWILGVLAGALGLVGGTVNARVPRETLSDLGISDPHSIGDLRGLWDRLGRRTSGRSSSLASIRP